MRILTVLTVLLFSFSSFAYTPGAVSTPAMKRPILFSFGIGGASVLAACTSSPCTIYNNKGGIITAATRSATGRYALTFASLKSGTSYNCSMMFRAYTGASSGVSCYSLTESITSMTLACDSTAGQQDAAISFVCHGEVP